MTAGTAHAVLGTSLLPAATAVALGLLLPVAVRPLLVRLGVVDVPSERSSHAAPTIRGMGLATAVAVVLACLLGWALDTARDWVPTACFVLLGMLGAGLMGWVEDWRGLPVRVRLLGQLGLGAVVTSGLALGAGASAWWIPVGAFAVAAYVNIANFMDGLNGISGLHGLVVGLAYAWAGGLEGLSWLVVLGACLAAGYAAFLPWNLFGGRVFLGDTGSYFLGGTIACAAVGAFLEGVPVEYLLAPVAVYVVDTSSTLLLRIYRGEAWYLPHRQHVYQRLTDAGLSHLGSSAVVAAASALVAVTTLLSLHTRWSALSTLVAVLVLVLYLALPWLLGQRAGRGAEGRRA